MRGVGEAGQSLSVCIYLMMRWGKQLTGCGLRNARIRSFLRDTREYAVKFALPFCSISLEKICFDLGVNTLRLHSSLARQVITCILMDEICLECGFRSSLIKTVYMSIFMGNRGHPQYKIFRGGLFTKELFTTIWV